MDKISNLKIDNKLAEYLDHNSHITYENRTAERHYDESYGDFTFPFQFILNCKDLDIEGDFKIIVEGSVADMAGTGFTFKIEEK